MSEPAVMMLAGDGEGAPSIPARQGSPVTIAKGGVNSYLLSATDGFVLIDTGKPESREALARGLERAECGPGDLRLILLTHGDYDHAGNAAFLRATHGAPIALHPAEVGKVERGDWAWGLKPAPDRFAQPYRFVSRFIRPGAFETFSPDVLLADGQELAGYGLDAQVLHLPGHTGGSVGVLTASGDLCCGDLLDGLGRPGLQFFIDDMAAATASLERLRSLDVRTVYPGHGRPFPFARLRRTTAA